MRRFCATKDGRLVLAYGTGVGKTPTSITALMSHLALHCANHPRILVVCPAIVRRHWVAEFRRWAEMPAAAIEMGRHRRSGTKAALAARDAAYQAQVQVVSYDLAPQVDAQGWDGVILDEIHHLSDYRSKQSEAIRGLLAANQGVPCIGLSATLIPTKLHQLWHPLDLLWPGKFGRAPRTGSIPWDFVGKYQHVLDDGYGCYPGPARQERLDELKARLDKVAHRLTREDISANLPPVDAKVLELPGQALGRGLRAVGRPAPEVEAAVQWHAAQPPDITHSVILVYHRQLAHDIAHALLPHLKDGTALSLIDGQRSTGDRVDSLAIAERAPRALVIATTESIREGIRLMWAQRVLYAEWRQSPKQVVQTLGRFTNVSDPRRPQIDVLTDESLRERARTLLERIDDINAVITPGSTEQRVAQVFKIDDLTDDQLATATRAMFAQRAAALDPDWAEDEEDEDHGF